MTYPLAPAPAGFAHLAPSRPMGVYHPGQTVTFTLDTSGANHYTVRDFTGTTVSSGSCTGTTVTPTPPTGGWPLGWYRIHLTGPSTDAVFGPSYGATNFSVVADDPRMPPVQVGGDGYLLRPWAPIKAAMGMGTQRLEFPNPADRTAPAEQTWAEIQAAAADSLDYWNVPNDSPYYDAARPRTRWAAFTSFAFDCLINTEAHLFMCRDETLDGSTITVAVSDGTSHGQKVTVVSDATTEVFDNLDNGHDAMTNINGHSALIVCLTAFLATPLLNAPATAIGRAVHDGIAHVVQTLYPLGVTRYEGPTNEPPLFNPDWIPVFVHGMRLFASAVHDGHPDAKAIGPCPVSVWGPAGARWDLWAAQGGFAYCDEISFHAYNNPPIGDLSGARYMLGHFIDQLEQLGVGDKTLWQTESTWGFGNTYGIYHPRGTAATLRLMLLFEQIGVPRERNNYWYDVSHGFWAVPAWWINGDRGLEPQAAMMRTLALETFGRVHTRQLDFGRLGDHIVLGSVYSGGVGDVVALIGNGYIDGLTATLTVIGAAETLTMVDGWGNTTDLTVTDGLVTVPLDTETPRYLRLPPGVHISTLATVNGWPLDPRAVDHLTRYTHRTVPPGDTTDQAAIDNLAWTNSYPHNTVAGSPDQAMSHTGAPATVTMLFDQPTLIDTLLIWSGLGYQVDSVLLAFAVDTSADGGTTWTERATVDQTATATSFKHGTDYQGQGCTRETYWPIQRFHQVDLGGPHYADAIRLRVSAVSCGGEPDAQCSTNVVGLGQGQSPGYLTIEQIVPVCLSSAQPRVVVADEEP